MSAGRSTWLDNGVDLYGLNPLTGKIIHKHHLESRHPVYEEGKDRAKPEHSRGWSQNKTDYKTFEAPDKSDGFSIGEGATSDVLVSDGRNVFMRQPVILARNS